MNSAERRKNIVAELKRADGPISAAALAAETVRRALEATDSAHWYGMSFERALPWLSASFNDLAEEAS